MLKQFRKKQNTCKITQQKLLQIVLQNLNDTQDLNLTKTIEIPEIKEAIFSMEHQKLPGIDRLPIDFYKQFLKQMKHLQKNLQ